LVAGQARRVSSGFESAEAAQREIAEEFALFGDWSERYQYLIDLGKALPAFPEALKLEENVLQGCQSQVYVHFATDLKPELKPDLKLGGKLRIQAMSDSTIVSGLIALVLRVYDGLTPSEILATEPTFIDAIGLGKNLSMTRKSGLQALISKIKAQAREMAQANTP
jgi:cysteine desulfuration protein SufE